MDFKLETKQKVSRITPFDGTQIIFLFAFVIALKSNIFYSFSPKNSCANTFIYFNHSNLNIKRKFTHFT
jgi:hypothetical protein